jgi:transcriptional regulator with XRE-family HTH domain
MNSERPQVPATAGGMAPQGESAGAIVRAARLRARLTLADLGHRCGYSASQISRYERGVQPLTDVELLRRFGNALAIPHEVFGLVPPNLGLATRHAGLEESLVAHLCGPRVGRDVQRKDGDDPVRRRELLAGAAGLAGSAALAWSAVGRAQVMAGSPAGLEDLLYSGATGGPVPIATLSEAICTARRDFQTARYDRLAAGLPGLISTAVATRGEAAGREGTASSLLADAYIAAANFMIKLNDDPLALTLADRALQAAQVGDDPLTTADARRAVATVLRRIGRRAKAREMLLSAAYEIQPAGRVSPEQLSMYGTLLATAAYTAAVDGNRLAASELIDEAQAAALRLGQDANYRFTAFGPTNVTLYQTSIAQVLGDNGTAIEHARTVRPAAIPTAERKGRYWIDVARAFHQWNKPESCYRALLAAERAAPAEVRYRPPVHRITEDLLRADRRSLPGLREFARRIGVPAA